jgi:hypothetical protein
MKKVFSFLLIAVMAVTIGCGPKKSVAVHPGAISKLDSYAYDLLLVEQDAIKSVQASFAQGALPPSSKEAINAAVAQYNVAEAAWQSYHAGLSKDTTILQNALDGLVGGVGALQQQLGKQVPEAGK